VQRRERTLAGSSRLDNFLKVGVFDGFLFIGNGR
jgi:hypothetical protein